MKKLVISLMLIMFISIPSFAFTFNETHFFWGGFQQGLYRHWGVSKLNALIITSVAACLKEGLDKSKGEEYKWDDIYSTILGALSWEISDGVYLSFKKVR